VSIFRRPAPGREHDLDSARKAINRAKKYSASYSAYIIHGRGSGARADDSLQRAHRFYDLGRRLILSAQEQGATEEDILRALGNDWDAEALAKFLKPGEST
jgi:hypothetical protein